MLARSPCILPRCLTSSRCAVLPPLYLTRGTQATRGRLYARATLPATAGRCSSSRCQAGTDEQGSMSSSSSDKGPPQPQGPSQLDPDLLFVGKLMATSFAVSALIKWGSLFLADFTSIPFTPNNTLAAIAVIGPPAFYALWFLSLGSTKE